MPFEKVLKNHHRTRTSVWVRGDNVLVPTNLHEEVGKHINILIDRNGKQFAIKSDSSGGPDAYTLTKNGQFTCKALNRWIIEEGIVLPVRIDPVYDSELDAWIFTLPTT